MKQYVNLTISFFIILIAILAFSVYFFIGQGNLEASLVSASQKSGVASDDPALANPLSIPSLRARHYDGANFKIGETLEENDDFTKYAISYRGDDLNISGVFYRPKGEGPFPLLIVNHGYINPLTYTTGRGLQKEEDFLAAHGFAILHSDYRNHAFSDEGGDSIMDFRTNYVIDVINSLEAIKKAKLPYINYDRMGMMGHSMGGAMAMKIMTIRNDIDAYVLYAPAAHRDKEFLEHFLIPNWPEDSQKLIELYGSPEENPDFYRQISAVTYFDSVDAPVLIEQGEWDEVMPCEWAVDIEKELREKRKNVTLHLWPEGYHEFYYSGFWEEFAGEVLEFFERYLKD